MQFLRAFLYTQLENICLKSTIKTMTFMDVFLVASLMTLAGLILGQL